MQYQVKEYYEEYDPEIVLEYIDESLRKYVRIAINVLIKDRSFITILKK